MCLIFCVMCRVFYVGCDVVSVLYNFACNLMHVLFNACCVFCSVFDVLCSACVVSEKLRALPVLVISG